MKESENLLDLIPKKNDAFRSETDEKGIVTIFVENKGFFNFLMQKIFLKPRFTQVHLEEFGSFIWSQIDGKRTVSQIADLLHEKFKEKAEPLYPRIGLYMKNLLNYDFVKIENHFKVQ